MASRNSIEVATTKKVSKATQARKDNIEKAIELLEKSQTDTLKKHLQKMLKKESPKAPRTPSAYNLFIRDCNAKAKAKGHNGPLKENMESFGAKWKALSAAEKQRYKDDAATLKEEAANAKPDKAVHTAKKGAKKAAPAPASDDESGSGSGSDSESGSGSESEAEEPAKKPAPKKAPAKKPAAPAPKKGKKAASPAESDASEASESEAEEPAKKPAPKKPAAPAPKKGKKAAESDASDASGSESEAEAPKAKKQPAPKKGARKSGSDSD